MSSSSSNSSSSGGQHQHRQLLPPLLVEPLKPVELHAHLPTGEDFSDEEDEIIRQAELSGELMMMHSVPVMPRNESMDWKSHSHSSSTAADANHEAASNGDKDHERDRDADESNSDGGGGDSDSGSGSDDDSEEDEKERVIRHVLRRHQQLDDTKHEHALSEQWRLRRAEEADFEDEEEDDNGNIPVPSERDLFRMSQFYQLHSRLSRGDDASVFAATASASAPSAVTEGQWLAIKFKSQRYANEQPMELTCLARCNPDNRHPHLPKAYGWHPLPETRSVAIVQQLAAHDSIAKCVFGNIAVIRTFMRQLMSTLATCHQAGVVHRDIKYGNIMWDDDRQSLTLIDFDVSAINVAGKYLLRKNVGTEGYEAPEIQECHDAREQLRRKLNSESEKEKQRRKQKAADKKSSSSASSAAAADGNSAAAAADITTNNPKYCYGEKIDIYSSGVVMAQMLLSVRDVGSNRDEDNCASHMRKRLRKAIDSMAGRPSKSLSQEERSQMEANDLALRMMDRNPQHRISAATALQHVFFKTLSSSSSS